MQHFSGSYRYVGVRSSDGTLYLDDITFTYGENTAENLSNYIMFEDTNNQCEDKYDDAESYFLGLPISERNSFMNNNDYVISTARERFEAWNRHLGKNIIHINGDYVIDETNHISVMNNDNGVTMILIVLTVSSFMALTTIVFFRKKKRQ